VTWRRPGASVHSEREAAELLYPAHADRGDRAIPPGIDLAALAGEIAAATDLEPSRRLQLLAYACELARFHRTRSEPWP